MNERKVCPVCGYDYCICNLTQPSRIQALNVSIAMLEREITVLNARIAALETENTALREELDDIRDDAAGRDYGDR